MIFERLDEWIWSLEHDKPPAMSGVAPQLALESLARDLWCKQKRFAHNRVLIEIRESITSNCVAAKVKLPNATKEIKTYEKEIEAHSVRIAEIMKGA